MIVVQVDQFFSLFLLFISSDLIFFNILKFRMLIILLSHISRF